MYMRKQNRLMVDRIASALMIIGALAWGIYAFGLNVVEFVFGSSFVSSLTFFLVGISGLWTLFRKPLTGKKFMN